MTVEPVADEAAQIVGAEIARLDDLETGTGESLGDQAGIVDGGRQRAAFIGALPDHKRKTTLSRRNRRLPGYGREGKAEENDSTFQKRHGRRTLSPALRVFASR
jgi:hypothetical protein